MLRGLLLVIALAAGGGAAWLAIALRPAPAPVVAVVEAPRPSPTLEVLVAAEEIGPSQSLTAANLRWQSWPETSMNAGYITKTSRPDAVETLSGAVARTRLVEGEPVRDKKLLHLKAGFLSSVLASGRRAVAVRVSAENTAGGFILPGDHVDILCTTRAEGDGQGAAEHVTRTVLRNVAVLAIDQAIDDDAASGRSKEAGLKDATPKEASQKSKTVAVGKTATLELDSPQAELLTAAEASGTLSLALRSAVDNAERSVSVENRKSQSVSILRPGRADVVKTQ